MIPGIMITDSGDHDHPSVAKFRPVRFFLEKGELDGNKTAIDAILIASQLPVADWHGVIGDPNQADAICDRLLHNAHRIELKGRSMRQTKAAPKPSSKEPA